MTEGLRAITGITCPEAGGAFYLFPDVSGLFGRSHKGRPVTTSAQMADIPLADYAVAVVPGEPFGAPGHIRLSFATSMETVEKGITRIAEFARGLTA